jgi:putative addiction module killer protein
VIEIIKSATFESWLVGLKDRQARLRVISRIERLSAGNPGDVKPVGAGVSELGLDHGPGYRVYFMQRGALVIVLLAGGDKRTQDADIKLAIKIAQDWKE